ncbi:MAG: PAS domain S-box protein [Deltaproteobacteria bacterium]|nr:PAS domain S-box protein [Deltaproteobacteria bacterium]
MTGKEVASASKNALHQQTENAAPDESIVVAGNQGSLSPEESGRLLHELRAHQIELEMQNDELRRAHAELDASRARYFDLFDLAPMGYFALSEKGLVMEANLAAVTLLKATRSVLATQPLSRFILREDQDIYYRRLKKLFETGMAQTCELRMLRADHSPFWAQLDVFATNGSEGSAACRAVIIDITERKQLKDAQLFLLKCGSTGSGDDFFKSLARYLAQSLGMDYVCIDRLEGEGLSARTVAVYFDGNFEDNVSYALKDTPCGDVVGKTICCFDRSVRHLFPRDVVLQEMKAESYVGTTLWSFDGKPIGLIAVISRHPLANPGLAESMLKMSAVRAAGELERLQAIDILLENEKKLQKSHAELEDRVKERTLALTLVNEQLLREIDERLQAEKALAESEEKYRSIFHNQYANMLLIDPETLDIVDANPAACSFYGYAREEMTTKKLIDISTLSTDRIFQKITRILENQKEHFFFSHRMSDGRIREVEVFVCTVQIIGKAFLFSVIYDITERRQMEQRIVETSEFIRKIFDASPLGIAAYEAAGQCVMANDAVGRIIGANREAVLQQNFNHLDSWKKSGLWTAAREVIQTNQSREDLEFHFVTTFGKDVTLHCSLIPFSSANKPHLLMMGQDISRQKQADEALRQSQKLASIGLLVAGIAHEINNPNGFIIFNIPILRDYLQELLSIVDDYMGDHPNQRVFGRSYEEFRKDLFKLLDNIEHGSQRIDATVSGLKDFSRKREKLVARRVALKPIIEHAVSFCREEIRIHVKSLHLAIPDDLPPILTDPEAIEQILINLLINAAHASDKEDSWIGLCVNFISGTPGRCVISIDDNGCGMDEKTLKRIFDPFYTRKTSIQGTGLGLYICQSLVEGLGGRIEVESKPDLGSSFKVILNDYL